MISTEQKNEMRRTSPFADEVVEVGALQIDEGVLQRSLSLDPPFVLSFDAAEKKGVEWLGKALEQLGGEVISGTDPVLDADDEVEDTFVDVFGSGQRDEGAESEDFTFEDALIRANHLSETVLEDVVSSSELPLCWSSFLIFVSLI